MQNEGGNDCRKGSRMKAMVAGCIMKVARWGPGYLTCFYTCMDQHRENQGTEVERLRLRLLITIRHRSFLVSEYTQSACGHAKSVKLLWQHHITDLTLVCRNHEPLRLRPLLQMHGPCPTLHCTCPTWHAHPKTKIATLHGPPALYWSQE